MTKREYAEQVAKIVGGEVIEVEKPNMVTLTGVQYGKDDAVKPCYYIDGYYDDELDVEQVAEKIKAEDERQFGNITKIKNTVSSISNFGTVKDLLRIRLYNNQSKFEVSQNAAKYGFNDLIMVPYIEFGNGMAAKITAAIVKAWGIDENEVFDNAINNTSKDVVVKNMREMLAEMMSEELLPEDEHEMTVVTNESRSFGASAVLFAKDKLQEIFKDGYIVIPSSVHEVIVMSKDGIDMEMVCGMIGEVNETQVGETERLSNHAYEF